MRPGVEPDRDDPTHVQRPGAQSVQQLADGPAVARHLVDGPIRDGVAEGARNAHLVLAAQIDLAVPVDVLRREAAHRVGLDELDSDLRVVEERGLLLRQVGLELCGDVLSQPLFDPLDVDVHAELEEAERRDPLGNDALWQPESVGPETLVAERLVPIHLAAPSGVAAGVRPPLALDGWTGLPMDGERGERCRMRRHRAAHYSESDGDPDGCAQRRDMSHDQVLPEHPFVGCAPAGPGENPGCTPCLALSVYRVGAKQPVLLIQPEGDCPESAAPRGSNEGAPSAWPRHRRSVRTASAKPDPGPWPPPSCRRSPRCAPAIPRSARRRVRSAGWGAVTVPHTPPTSSMRPPAHRAVRSLP